MSPPRKNPFDRTILIVILIQLVIFNMAVYLSCPRKEFFSIPALQHFSPSVPARKKPPPPQESASDTAPPSTPQSHGTITPLASPRLRKKAVDDYFRQLEQDYNLRLTQEQRNSFSRIITKNYREARRYARKLDGLGLSSDKSEKFAAMEAARAQQEAHRSITNILKVPERK